MKRTAYEVLAASLASFALAALLPAQPLGGVRGMLVVLPVVGALFASVGRAVAGKRGDPGRRSHRPGGVESLLWCGWVVLAFHHPALGLPGSAEIVVAAGLALAGGRTLALGLRLRQQVERSALWPFFALPLAVYLLAWPWATTARAPDGDEPYYLLLTHSLAYDLDVDLANDYRSQVWKSFTTVPVGPQPGDPTGPSGEVYSRHSALLPLALAPLYRLAGPFGAQLGMLACAAAAAAAGLSAARARFPGRPRGLLAAWAVLAFAPPLLLYAGQFWVEVPAALLVALVLRSLARLAPTPPTPGTSEARPALPPTPGELAGLALPLLALPLLKLRLLALAAPLAILAAVRLRGSLRRRRELRLAALAVLAAVVALGALGLWNFWRYGHALRMYRGSDLAIFAVPLSDQARGGAGLFFDAAFGLFALAPIWLLLLPALVVAARTTSRDRAERRALAEIAVFVPYLLLIGMRREWYGGWSPPFRYGVVLLPALALLLVPLFAERRASAALRLLCAVLSALTATIALVYLVHPAWTYSLANGSSRLLDELSRDLAGDFVRLFPSMVRLRPASWIVPVLLGLTCLAAGLRHRSAAVSSRRLQGRFLWPLAALVLLLGWSGLLVAAQALPTSRIEFEDAWMSHRGGALYPERWTVDRTRFDGGWALRRDAEISVRPVAGGRTCRLAIRLLPGGDTAAALALEVRTGEKLVATLVPSARSAGGEPAWEILETGTFEIPPGAALVFRAVGSPSAGAGVAAGIAGTQSLLVLDRAEVFWR